jgi:hypothetical protein
MSAKVPGVFAENQFAQRMSFPRILFDLKSEISDL